MKAVSGKRLARLLEQHGWERKRISGSHHIYVKQGQSARISIPIHGNKLLKMGLQHHLMKIANISEYEL